MAGKIVVIGYDSGEAQIDAINSGLEAGAITQNPIGIGAKCVSAAMKAIAGETCRRSSTPASIWYDKTNINDPEIRRSSTSRPSISPEPVESLGGCPHRGQPPISLRPGDPAPARTALHEHHQRRCEAGGRLRDDGLAGRQQRGYTSTETRARVEAAIEELGYVPNALARQLRSKQTKTIALVVSDISNPFFTTIARGVEDFAVDHGFSVMYCNTDESEAEEEQYLLHADRAPGRRGAARPGPQLRRVASGCCAPPHARRRARPPRRRPQRRQRPLRLRGGRPRARPAPRRAGPPADRRADRSPHHLDVGRPRRGLPPRARGGRPRRSPTSWSTGAASTTARATRPTATAWPRRCWPRRRAPHGRLLRQQLHRLRRDPRAPRGGLRVPDDISRGGLRRPARGVDQRAVPDRRRAARLRDRHSGRAAVRAHRRRRPPRAIDVLPLELIIRRLSGPPRPVRRSIGSPAVAPAAARSPGVAWPRRDRVRTTMLTTACSIRRSCGARRGRARRPGADRGRQLPAGHPLPPGASACTSTSPRTSSASPTCLRSSPRRPDRGRPRHAPDNGAEPAIFAEFRALLPGTTGSSHSAASTSTTRPAGPDLALADRTGERRIDANILLTIGVVPPEA